MANEKNLLDFPTTTSAESADWVHIQQGGVDKKISLADFISELNGGNPFNITVREESGSNRILTVADKNAYIRCLNATQTTIQVKNAQTVGWKKGDSIVFRKEGLGNVLIAADSGVTIRSAASGLSLTEVGQAGQLICVDDTPTATIFDFVTGGNARATVTGSITFLTVDAMEAGATNDGLTVDFAELAANNTLVETIYNNTTSKKGGAKYIIKTAAQVVADGDGIDGYGNHWLLGDTAYAAILQKEANGYNSLSFGCDGVDDTAALEAWNSFSDNLLLDSFDYVTSGLTLNGGGSYDEKSYSCNPCSITDDTSVTILQWFNANMDGNVSIHAPVIYLAGLRYCKFNKINFDGLVKWGHSEGEVPSIGSYSIYWSHFDTCKFEGGQQVRSSITNANFNSNQFSNCELRGGTNALIEFYNTSNNDPVFSSNTYINCDMSYNAVFYVSDSALTSFSAVQILGGYLDTGTAVYASGSEKFGDLEVIGLRNPSGHLIDNAVTKNLQLTTGGARTKTNLPAGSKSFLITEQIPSAINGTGTTNIMSAPLPYTGAYSINSYMSFATTPLSTTVFTNVTTSGVTNSPISSNGRDSFTFEATQGDVVQLSLVGQSGADVNIHELSLTGGAGVVDAVPYRTFQPDDIYDGTVTSSAPVDITSFNIGTFKKGQMYEIDLFTQNQVAAGGGELIKYLLAACSGGSSMAFSIAELSRVSVNGVGGTSDDSGTATLSASAATTTITLTISLTGITSTDYRMRIYPAKSAKI
jgi:hypothetical protein